MPSRISPVLSSAKIGVCPSNYRAGPDSKIVLTNGRIVLTLFAWYALGFA